MLHATPTTACPPVRASDLARRRRPPREAAARRSIGLIRAHRSVAWWLLHKPLRYPVRYDEVQRADFAGGQMSRENLSIAARRPCTASRNKSRDARLEILQRPHLCATASMECSSGTTRRVAAGSRLAIADQVRSGLLVRMEIRSRNGAGRRRSGLDGVGLAGQGSASGAGSVGVVLVGEVPDPDVAGLDTDNDVSAQRFRVGRGSSSSPMYRAAMRRATSVTPSSMNRAEPRTSTPRSGASDSATTMVARGSRRRCRAFAFSASTETLNPPSCHSCHTGESRTVPSGRRVASTATSGSSRKSFKSATVMSVRTQETVPMAARALQCDACRRRGSSSLSRRKPRTCAALSSRFSTRRWPGHRREYLRSGGRAFGPGRSGWPGWRRPRGRCCLMWAASAGVISTTLVGVSI